MVLHQCGAPVCYDLAGHYGWCANHPIPCDHDRQEPADRGKLVRQVPIFCARTHQV